MIRMKEFTSSPDFVEKTMAAVRAVEAEEKSPRLSWYMMMRPVAGYAGAAGALLIGIVNLLRLLAAVYAPVVCH
jgi:hypothetical protein